MFLLRRFIILIFLCGIPTVSFAGSPIPFTVNLDETVVVTGTPRLQLDIGGVTRYAPYVSGSGTNALSFGYSVVAPDFDRDGITLVSPLDLNGGTIRDANGNNANLTFVPPNTSGVLVQSYTVAWTTSPVNGTNETATAFNILNAPIGATYNYTITSDGGGGSVTGSGSIAANPESATGVDVSSLPAGTLTLSVTVTNGTGTGNAKTNTVSGAFTGVLDTLPASAAAYSVRRLRSAYTGALIRVRRSSDSTEQDIGPTLGGNLNTTALTTFCGANSCFVTTWYDQSGNTRNATQATLANQPRIVNAGVIDTFNSRAGINWISAQSHHFLTGYVFSLALTTVNIVFKPNSLVSSQLFDIRSNGSGNPLIDCGNLDGYATRRRDDGGTLVSTATHTNRNTSAHVTTKTYDGSTISSFLDGGDLRTAASTSTTAIGTFRIAIGTNGLTPGSSLYNGFMGEFIYLNSVLLAADRLALEANQKTYYGTP